MILIRASKRNIEVKMLFRISVMTSITRGSSYHFIIKTIVFKIMHHVVTFSNHFFSYILKKKALNLFSGGFSFYNGSDLKTSCLRSIHSFYLSVKRLLPPILSCSKLKVLIMTPTKRFRKKKDPKITKMIKKAIQKKLASVSATGR